MFLLLKEHKTFYGAGTRALHSRTKTVTEPLQQTEPWLRRLAGRASNRKLGIGPTGDFYDSPQVPVKSTFTVAFYPKRLYILKSPARAFACSSMKPPPGRRLT